MVLARVVVVGDALADDSPGWLARWYDAEQPGLVAEEPPAGDGPVLVLGERRHELAVGREAAMVADRPDVAGVARRLLVHGPLAVRHLAELTASHWEHGASRAVRLLDLVAPRTFSAVWLPRVSGLEDPPPSLGQHLRSWLPTGLGFVAVHSPDAGVHRTRALPAPGAGSTRSTLLVAGTAPDEAVEQVRRAIGATDVRTVPSVIGLRARYGGDKGAEFVALPDDVAALLPSADGVAECHVCGLVRLHDTCPFCHAGSVPLQVLGES